MKRQSISRAKTIKLLGQNIGTNLQDLELGNSLLDMVSKAQATTMTKK